MLMEKLDSKHRVLSEFGDLNAYERGVVARALLENLIGKGVVVCDPHDGVPGEISIAVEKSDLALLARFSKRRKLEEEADQEILRDRLRQVR